MTSIPIACARSAVRRTLAPSWLQECEILQRCRVRHLSTYLDRLIQLICLFPNTKNETFEVILRASTNIVMSILLPDFAPFAELVAHMPQEEIQVFLTLAMCQQVTYGGR